ncbi:MAG: hypothetical protein CW716_04620 [Candidatus Bathyarchaeum sp.]|nr:MAG: hypothetical protein CW716_04620 [Candidatus Bathyarchaeum sp.]
MSISTKEELQFLLHRAWEIEKKFESLSAWKGFVSVGQTFRSTVLTLARESYTHRLNLEKLLKSLNLEATTNEIPDGVFDFTGMLDSEAIQKIVENDEIVKDLYTKIVETTDPKVVSELSGGKNTDFFYQTLKRMIEDETRHISMVKKTAGRIERIQ